MDIIEKIALVLLIVGGLNWGLYGLFGLDLVAMLLGQMTILSKIVYGAVGLSAVYALFTTLMKK
ncbi:MAG: DUF378 domain-containing protein [Candidatus Paceibacterota bacterium]|jgi:hypothetical protein|nr:DUF378 domain-containing protein [Candidatus Paceibacterota bacterium]MDD4830728.1 DUF378 domain-containing protein [Candidatus Paceibacterota bacterium]MDD4875123.1 DUF378 domain-containing protein [Candidatus Paceibacterota bacterium]